MSFFGSMITTVAFPYQVYQLTHSVLLVGVLGVFEFGAILAVAFVGGALWLYRHPSRRVALRLYLFSLAYLALLFGAMVLDVKL